MSGLVFSLCIVMAWIVVAFLVATAFGKTVAERPGERDYWRRLK